MGDVDDDRAALRRLVERYARAADGRDASAFADTFTVDGVLRVGDHEIVGRDRLLGVAPRLGRYQVTMHLVANQHIEFMDAGGAPTSDASDRASGEVYCVARHVYDRDGVGRVSVMHIRYHDRYRRVGGGWRIEHRRLEALFEEDHPLVT